MERDWGLSGACHGLQSHVALHNPRCAINRIMEHVRLLSVRYGTPNYNQNRTGAHILPLDL